jgi:hypothetical protein
LRHRGKPPRQAAFFFKRRNRISRRDEVSVARCETCGGVQLRDLLARRRSTCPICNAVGARGESRGDESPLTAL